MSGLGYAASVAEAADSVSDCVVIGGLLDEGQESVGGSGLLAIGRGCLGQQPPSPCPLPQWRLLRNSAVAARKTLTPTLSHGEREQERPHRWGRGTVLQRSLNGEGKNGCRRRESASA